MANQRLTLRHSMVRRYCFLLIKATGDPLGDPLGNLMRRSSRVRVRTAPVFSEDPNTVQYTLVGPSQSSFMGDGVVVVNDSWT